MPKFDYFYAKIYELYRKIAIDGFRNCAQNSLTNAKILRLIYEKKHQDYQNQYQSTGFYK